jgi:hypothetical protein
MQVSEDETRDGVGRDDQEEKVIGHISLDIYQLSFAFVGQSSW